MSDFEEMLRKLDEKLQELNDTLESKYGWIDDKIQDSVKDAVRRVKEAVSRDWSRFGKAKTDGEEGQTRPEREDKIASMAPFMDERTLQEVVTAFLDGDLDTDMQKILPFIGKRDVARLMQKVLENGGEWNGLKTEHLYPFAEEETVDEAFLASVRRGEPDRALFPYVSDDCWHKIVREYCEDEDSAINVDEFYPYLNDDDLNLLMRTYIKRQKKK